LRYFRKILPPAKEEINTRLGVRARREFSCLSLFTKYQCYYEIVRCVIDGICSITECVRSPYKVLLQNPMAKYGVRDLGLAGEEYGGGGSRDPGVEG